MGVDPDADQRWPVYARSLLAFSLVCVLCLYALQRLQPELPLSLGFPGVAPDQAFNTAVSFVTNTNWQSYSGESTMGHLVQMAGLAVQNFVSAAVGIAVAVALVRGLRPLAHRPARQLLGRPGPRHPPHPAADRGRRHDRAGRLGAVQNLSGGTEVTTLDRPAADDHRRPGRLPGGHQGARHQRRRLLQRQLRAPVREPQRADQPARDLPAPADPVLAATHLRPDGRGEAAGLRDPRGDGRHLGSSGRERVPAGGQRAGYGVRAGRRRDGGQGDPVRCGGLGAVRGLHHADVDRRGQLLPRLLHGRSAAGCCCST